MDTASDLVFRRATAEDVPDLETLINTAFRDDHTTEVFLSPASARSVTVTSASALRTKLAQPDTAVFVATDARTGALVAHCSVRLLPDGRTAWFGLLAVAVSHKGRGVGSSVLAYAERYAREQLGAARMAFDVVNSRAGLIAWYERRGYRPTGGSTAFPYEAHEDWQGVLRDDLWFVDFGKDLV